MKEMKRQRARELKQPKKRKSSERVWDKVVAQTHPDFIQEQQNNDACSQPGSEGRDEERASMNDDTDPDEDQAEGAGNHNESNSVMTANKNIGTCLDPMSPDYDEDEALRVATEKSINDQIRKNEEQSTCDYKCPEILAQLSDIMAEIKSLPEHKRPSRKAYWDQVEEEWQAAQREREKNGLWDYFGMSMEHFFDVFKTEKESHDALRAAEHWDSSGCWATEAAQTNDGERDSCSDEGAANEQDQGTSNPASID